MNTSYNLEMVRDEHIVQSTNLEMGCDEHVVQSRDGT